METGRGPAAERTPHRWGDGAVGDALPWCCPPCACSGGWAGCCARPPPRMSVGADRLPWEANVSLGVTLRRRLRRCRSRTNRTLGMGVPLRVEGGSTRLIGFTIASWPIFPEEPRFYASGEPT